MPAGDIERTARLIRWAGTVEKRVGRRRVGWERLAVLARAAGVTLRLGDTAGVMYLPRVNEDGSILAVVDQDLPEYAREYVGALVIAAAREGTTVEDTAHEAFAWAVLRGDRTRRRRQLAELRLALCAEWAEQQLSHVQRIARRGLLVSSAVSRSAAAFIVARDHRRGGRPEDATAWFERAAALAKAEGAYRRAAIAKVALGGLRVAAGDLDGAESWYLKALDVARLHRTPEAAAWPLHDLFHLAVERGEHDRVEELSHLALEAYGAGHPNLCRLAGDVGYSYLQRGQYADARPIFEIVATGAPRGDVRTLAWAYAARCAASLSDDAGFRFASAQAWRLIDEGAGGVLGGEALVELAAAAATVGRDGECRRAGRCAVELALGRHEPKVLVRAMDLLAVPATAETGANTLRNARGGERFARRLVGLLRAAA